MDKPTNDWIRGKIGLCPSPLDNINDRKMRYLGHVVRTDGLTKDRLFGTIPGKRGRGRPEIRVFDNVKDIADISMVDLLRMARNRSQWRRFVESVTAGQQRPSRQRERNKEKMSPMLDTQHQGTLSARGTICSYVIVR